MVHKIIFYPCYIGYGAQCNCLLSKRLPKHTKAGKEQTKKKTINLIYSLSLLSNRFPSHPSIRSYTGRYYIYNIPSKTFIRSLEFHCYSSGFLSTILYSSEHNVITFYRIARTRQIFESFISFFHIIICLNASSVRNKYEL